jgi:tRNA (cmo5U34)-methyltransferase
MQICKYFPFPILVYTNIFYKKILTRILCLMPAHSFSPVAPFYDRLSGLVFGSCVYQAQAVHLGLIPAGARVLLIGGGTGQILAALLQHTACREVVFLEASHKMLARARQAVAPLKEAGRVVFRLGTEEDIGPGEKFDVVLTFFFLDLFSPALLGQITTRLSGALEKGGWWLASDFGYPQGSRLRKGAAALLFSSMYLFFRLTCGLSATRLPDWPAHLTRLGLNEVKSCYFYHGLIRAAAYRKTGG